MTTPRTDQYTVSWAKSISSIDQDEWDALALPMDSPFQEWQWLKMLEDSKSATIETGWHPLHIQVRHCDQLVAAAPLYLKAHSTGEFVFDHVWADVANKIGVRYYPKILGMSPFSPITGYQLMVLPTVSRPLFVHAILREIERFMNDTDITISSFNFVDPQTIPEFESHLYRAWVHQSYYWPNPGFSCFDDFLSTLTKNRRKTIRRERRELKQTGLEIRVLEGDEITHDLMDLMYDLYDKTNESFGVWSCKFLTKEFFHLIVEHYRHRIAVVAAYEKGSSRPVAMSLLMHKGEKLYGRYWGSFEEIRFLHFELCYYTPMEWAIEKGFTWYDPGMGGEHKANRGFYSAPSYSLHRLKDSRLDSIFHGNIDRINDLAIEEIEQLNATLPYNNRM